MRLAGSFRPVCLYAVCLGTWASLGAEAAIQPAAGPSEAECQALCVFVPQAPKCQALGLFAPQAPTLVVDKDTNTASAVIRICNGAKAAVTLNLSASDFCSETTKRWMGSSAIPSAADAAAKPYFNEVKPEPLAPGGCANVKLDVAKLWEAGESRGQFYQIVGQDRCKIADLTAIRYRVPFTVKSGALPTDKEDALFYRNQPAPVLYLRNDDPMTYLVAWELVLEGQSVASGDGVLLPSNSSLPVKIEPSQLARSALFSWPASGTIQDDLQSGKLSVHLKSSSTGDAGSLPRQEIPVKVRLRYWNRGWQEVWNLVWIVLVLALGAIISITLNFGIPNLIKRNAAKKQIADLNQKLRSIAPLLDSNALTFLRVESRRLKEHLADGYFFSPNFAADLLQLQEDLKLLATRIAAVQQIAQVRDALRNACRMPPFLLDSALANADRLLAQATRSDLSAADAAGLPALVATLQAQIASAGQVNSDLETAGIGAEKALRADIPCQDLSGLTDTSWKFFLPELEHLFESLAKAGDTLQPDDYYDRDMVVQALRLMQEFLRHQDPSQLGNAGLAELKSLLQQGSYASLVKARILVRASGEGIYEKTLITALQGTPAKVSLRPIPRTPLTFETVLFEARFAESALNTAAARSFITCEWEFSEDRASRFRRWWRCKPATDGGKEVGWAVSHYFTRPCVATVTARFRNSSQKSVKQGSEEELVLTARLPVLKRPRSGHIWLEVLRSSLALFVALLALISGAQEKIATLPLVQAFLAVLVLGLTADTVKNLMVKASS